MIALRPDSGDDAGVRGPADEGRVDAPQRRRRRRRCPRRRRCGRRRSRTRARSVRGSKCGGAAQADLLAGREQQLDAGVGPPLLHHLPHRLEQRRDGRLVVAAEDRVGLRLVRCPSTSATSIGSVAGTVSRWAPNMIGIPPSAVGGEAGDDVAAAGGQRGGGVVLRAPRRPAPAARRGRARRRDPPPATGRGSRRGAPSAGPPPAARRGPPAFTAPSGRPLAGRLRARGHPRGRRPRRGTRGTAAAAGWAGS